MLKDYYKILEISPQATPEEIRKSFRKLAMRYHPDKHTEDLVATAHFREIQEAYEVLTDPWRRDQYHQERWYVQSMGRKMKDIAPPTSSTILQELLALERHLFQQDPFRTDQFGLFTYLETILTEEAGNVLREEKQEAIIAEILRLALACGKNLDYMAAIRLTDLLKKFYPWDAGAIAQLDFYLQGKKREANWEKWKIPIVLLLSIGISVLIFFLS